MGDYAHPRLDCDLVMKGGITSGVVYPLAICRLAEHYRFRSIGGASAGAIAAAVAGAAEYARQTGSQAPGSGFDGLERLPTELTEDVGGGCSRLLSLFQAQPRTSKLLELLLLGIGPGGAAEKGARALAWLCWREWPFPLLSLAVVVALLAGALAQPPTVLALAAAVLASLATLAFGLVLAAIMLVRGGLRALRENKGGICLGYAKDHEPGLPPLCTWLADRIDTLAGRPLDGPPLTVGELAGKQIELLTITTNLTHGRP